jgi:RimJ/RimL family protein N-acetyltransferase
VQIEAEGCRLRSVREGDVQAIARACQDHEIARWLPHLPHPYRVEDARSFVELATGGREHGREWVFAIVDGTDTLLGVINVRLSEDPPTVGYWLAREARGRGIATAATIAISRWTFETFQPPRLALHAEPENLASVRVAEKSGFMRVPRTIRGLDDRELWVFELPRESERPAL